MKPVSIIGKDLPNIPWQEKPESCKNVIWRHSGNPIIGRDPTEKSARVFNSAVIPYKGGFIGAFRADHRDGIPMIHIGKSEDGLHWRIENEEINWVDESGKPWNPNYAYDPRLVEIENKYYMIWCTDFGGAALGMGVTEDFRTFTRLENPFLPFNRNGVLFPRRVNGKYLLLSRPSDGGHTPFGDIFLSESPDLIYWGRHRRVMTKGGGWWQNIKIGAGPAPIETSEGWLMLYHGVTNTCNGFVYSFGAALLDLGEPCRVLCRSRDYLLTPQAPYETTGFVPNVVFPCATLQDAATGRIAIYYGAADTCVAVAYARVDELVRWLKENSRLLPDDEVAFK